MIVALSLNPALDVTYRLDSPLELGGTNRVSDIAIRPGGKALNVARVFQHLCCTVRVVAPLGGPTGDVVRNGANGQGIDGDWVEVAARRNGAEWRLDCLMTPSPRRSPAIAGPKRSVSRQPSVPPPPAYPWPATPLAACG